MTPTSNRRWVLSEPGTPDVLRRQDGTVDAPGPGQALIRIRAIGLNHAEVVTRRGDSPSVVLPRVIGIEAVGVVVSDASGRFDPDQPVIVAMGGFGREFDGSYQDYCLVPAALPIPVDPRNLSWARMACLPIAFGTALGSMIAADVGKDDRLLIRGGTAAVGRAALAVAATTGVAAVGTTRRPAAITDDLLLDDDTLLPSSIQRLGGRPTRAIDLIGARSALDTMSLLGEGGITCSTGSLSDDWTLEGFTPIADLPTGGMLTAFSSDTFADPRWAPRFQWLIDSVVDGDLALGTPIEIRFDDLPDGHRLLEGDEPGKVIVTP